MAQVTLANVTKRFGDFTAVNDLTMEIEDGKFTVLVGPSGCGKTTTLRMVAGLEEVTAGEIKIGERTVNRVPPKDRDIAMVFQNYALYPHMDVFNNMAFGLKLRKTPKAQIRQRVHEAADLLGITDKLKSKPRELSGGQRQRVAVGRAIVRNPKVFLFDEPLSNLDAKLRLEMRAEITRIHAETAITTLYVTHDQKEALSMAKRLAVMRDGRVEQVGTPQEVYRNPASAFVAGFIGEANFFDGKVLEVLSGGRLTLETVLGRLVGARAGAGGSFSPGERVTCLVRPESLRVGDAEGLEARVTELTYLGELWECSLEVKGVPLKLKQLDPATPAPAVGAPIFVQIPPEAVTAFPPEASPG